MTQPAPPHSRSLREHRQTTGPGTFFVTKCTEPRIPILTGIPAGIIVDALIHYARIKRIALAAFVVMPDHWHALFAPLEPLSLSGVMARLNHWISRQTRDGLARRDAQWQDGFHETRIRSGRQFRFGIHYIENNPLANGLVTKASDWKWSSAYPASREFLARPWPWRFEKD